MARRASLERRERLEAQREENERRQRAEEEFQVSLRACVSARPKSDPFHLRETDKAEAETRRERAAVFPRHY